MVSKISQPQLEVLTLPTELSAPTFDISKASWMIYGPPDIGKSALAASFPDALFACLEKNHQHLRIYGVPIQNYRTLTALVDMLHMGVEGSERFKTIVLDTTPILYNLCEKYVCNLNGMDSPGEDSWGKGWDLVRSEWMYLIARLQGLNRGIIWICHEQDRETTEGGIKFNRMQPALLPRCKHVLQPTVTCCCRMSTAVVDGVTRRVLFLKPQHGMEVGCKVPQGIELPDYVTADQNDWYSVLKKAFQPKGGVQRIAK